MESHSRFSTPGMCCAWKVTLCVKSVNTIGRIMCMTPLCLLVCLLIIVTTAVLSQWNTICAFVNLSLKMLMARNIG